MPHRFDSFYLRHKNKLRWIRQPHDMYIIIYIYINICIQQNTYYILNQGFFCWTHQNLELDGIWWLRGWGAAHTLKGFSDGRWLESTGEVEMSLETCWSLERCLCVCAFIYIFEGGIVCTFLVFKLDSKSNCNNSKLYQFDSWFLV